MRKKKLQHENRIKQEATEPENATSSVQSFSLSCSQPTCIRCRTSLPHPTSHSRTTSSHTRRTSLSGFHLCAVADLFFCLVGRAVSWASMVGWASAGDTSACSSSATQPCPFVSDLTTTPGWRWSLGQDGASANYMTGYLDEIRVSSSALDLEKESLWRP